MNISAPAGYDYDVIIAGGGPAGSTAANYLTREGKKVLVLEREKFPRFHIGESLLPYNNDILREMGVWEKLDACNFMIKPGAEFFLGNATKSHQFWFTRNLPKGYGTTFQVERAKFDEILLNEAGELGSDVRQETKVTNVAVDDHGATVDFEGANGTTRATSRWFLDATGRDAFLGKQLRLEKSDGGFTKKIAIYAHFKGVLRHEGEAEGLITVVRLEDGWFWIIPIDKEKTSVGLVQGISTFKAHGRSPAEEFEHVVSSCTELRYRFKAATRVTPVHTTGDYTYRHRTFAGPRFFLVGDAGGFIDPIFSSGVMLAMQSGRLAAKMIARADEENRPLPAREQRAYTRKVRKMMDMFAKLIRMYYNNRAFEVFMNPTGAETLRKAVLQVLAGNTRMSWGDWWRVQAFYGFCWIQRWVPLSPRINYDDKAAKAAPLPAVTGP